MTLTESILVGKGLDKIQVYCQRRGRFGMFRNRLDT